MYHLAKGLYRYATSKEEYSVLLLGLDNAGKTTLHETIKALYQPDNPNPTSLPKPSAVPTPTVGQNVSTINLPDLYLKIWDVGGQRSLRGLWESYYAVAHAIVFVIDSADLGDGLDVSDETSGTTSGPVSGSGDLPGSSRKRKDGLDLDPNSTISNRLEECKITLESILQHSETEGVPLLVLANKQDREDCIEVVRIKEGLVKRVFEGEKGGSIRDSRVLPVSALKGTGVKEAVEWLRSRVKWNREGRPPVLR